MLFSRFFRRLNDALRRDLARERQHVFRADGTMQVRSNSLVITEANDHVHIRGELKSLRINGKLVRFKCPPCTPE